MATCPQCQLANPDGAETCARCGHGWRSAGTPIHGTGEATILRGEAGGASLACPLPPPMTEPIQTPIPSPQYTTPQLQAVATIPLRASRIAAASAGTSAPGSTHAGPRTLVSAAPVTEVTVRQRPAADPIPSTFTLPSATPVPAVPPASLLRPKLVVLRGERVGVEYPLYEGRNTIGRFVDRPVDIDLLSQESEVQVWCSRVHAVFTFKHGDVRVDDLNSLNGTWVNGVRITPGHPRVLKPGDVVQIGTVQLRFVVD